MIDKAGTSFFFDKKVIILDYSSSENPYYGGSSFLDCYSRLLCNWQVPYIYLSAQVNPNNTGIFIEKLQAETKKYTTQKLVILLKNRWLLNRFKEQLDNSINKFLIPGEKKARDKSLDQNQSMEQYKNEQPQVLRFDAYDIDNFKKYIFDNNSYNKQWQANKEYLSSTVTIQEFIKEVNQLGGPLANFNNLIETNTISKRSLLAGNNGCGFTRNIKKNSYLNQIEMPQEVQNLKGCSFCSIDPLELSKNSNQNEFIENIIKQIRFTQLSNKSVDSYISNDQHFLLYAQDLCTILLSNELPVNIFLETRASFLLQHQQELKNLLKLIENSKIKIIIHLIGFENFSQKILDIFNKGIKKEVLFKVIELLDNLDLSFPQQFKVKTGSHGFILFTPWTTFEHLKENFKYIERYQFEKYCGHLHLRRLRLSKNLPIYYKAKRDNLVRESEKKDSYAMQTGYSSDIGWEFQDKKTEMVYLLCKQMHNFSSKNPREILGDAINQVENTLKNKCRFNNSFDCEFSNHCLATTVFLPTEITEVKRGEQRMKQTSKMEFIGLEKGLRKLVKFEGSSLRKVESYEKEIRKQYCNYSILKVTGNLRSVFMIAKDKATLVEAQKLELQLQNSNSHSQDYMIASHKMGKLLGYPSCCTNQYLIANEELSISTLKDKARIYDLILNEKHFYCPLVQRSNLLVSYFSCSYSCENAIKNSRDHFIEFITENNLDKTDEIEIKNLFFALNQKLLYLDEENYFTFISTMDSKNVNCKVIYICGFEENKKNLLEINSLEITKDSFIFSTQKAVIKFNNRSHLLLFPGANFHLNKHNNFPYKGAIKNQNNLIKDIFHQLQNTFKNYEAIKLVAKGNATVLLTLEETINNDSFTIIIDYNKKNTSYFKKINNDCTLSYQGDLDQTWKHKFIKRIEILLKSMLTIN